MHHPCYSLDSVHGGCPDILTAIDTAIVQANRRPDAILSGQLQNPTMVSGVLALEVARLSGGLDDLRTPDDDWPARSVRRAHNAALARLHGDLH